MKSILFSFLSLLLVTISCKNHRDYSKEAAVTEIKEKVNKLYKIYGESNEAIYNQPIQKDLFSSDLEEVITNAISVSKTDIKMVKNSNYPDEKPFILEGAVFSSLYEGYSSYKIRSVDIVANRAKVFVDFEYDKVSPKIIWTDTIHFINSDNKWKIDNITFNNSFSTSADLQNSLNKFISYGEGNLN